MIAPLFTPAKPGVQTHIWQEANRWRPLLIEQYRGHAIRLARTSHWDAVLIELETGTTLPTKATALMREGRGVALARAQHLIDIYLDGTAARVSYAA